MLMSGVFIMSVRGLKRPIIYMSLYRFVIAFVLILNIFQTYNTEFYGHSIWNPLHLLGTLLGYPLLFAYMSDLIRPNSARLRFWMASYSPLADICGFKSRSAFSTFFKQTYGVTPTEWQAGTGVEVNFR
jgi:AraC-like DNA-binding protein